ncbi:MAG: hypothetical protein WAU07_02395 [Microgenomates group bacterium]
MSGPRPSPGGGPPPGAMPSMGGEGIPDDLMQQIGAQAGKSGTKGGGSVAQQLQAAQGMAGKRGASIGSVGDELKKFPQEIWEAASAFYSINTWLGIDPVTLTPDERQKAVAKHQRFESLKAEQKQKGQEMYQEEMEKKKKIQMEEEEKRRKDQQKAANQQAVLPSSPKKGPVGPGGSKKQKATQQLEQDRKTLSGPSGKN